MLSRDLIGNAIVLVGIFLPQIVLASSFDAELTTGTTFNVEASDAPLMVGNYGNLNYLASNPDCPISLGNHSYAYQTTYPISAGEHSYETTAATSGIDTIIALFSPAFNPHDPAENLISCDDDGGSVWPLSKITTDLELQTTYVVVVTTWDATPVNGTVTFETSPDVVLSEPTYTVSTQAGIHGGIAPTEQEVATLGTTTFTLTPESGYVIEEVTGCGGTLHGFTYTTAPITGACTVTATFKRSFYYPMILPATTKKRDQ